MKKSTEYILLGVLIFVLVICLFVIVSLAIAQSHNQSLITEWKSWFGVVKPVIDEVTNAIIKI